MSVTGGCDSDSRGRVSKVSGCLRGVELSQLLSLLVSSDVVDLLSTWHGAVSTDVSA